MPMSSRAKKRSALLVGAVLVLAGGAVGLHQFQKARIAQEGRDARVRGFELYESGEYEQAIPLLNRAYRGNKSDGEILYRLADARRRVPLENRRHITRAAQFAAAARDVLPADARPLNLLLDLYALQGFYKELLRTAEDVLEIDPADQRALTLRVAALYQLSREEDAVSASQEAIDRVPTSPELLASHIELLGQLDRPEEELAAIAEQRARDNADQVSFQALYAALLLRIGDRTGAVEVARRIADLPATNAAELLQALTLLDAVGESDAATAVLARAQQNPELRLDALVASAERAWRIGSTADAVNAIEAIGAELIAEGGELLGRGAVIERIGRGNVEGSLGDRGPVAIALFDRTDNELEPWQQVILGFEESASGDLQAARERLSRLLSIGTRLPVAYFVLGRVEELLGEPEFAAERYGRAVDLDPRWLVARLRLIEQLLVTNQPAEAYRQASEAATYHPRNGAAALALGATGSRLAEEGALPRQAAESMLEVLASIDEQLLAEKTALAYRVRVLAAIDRTAEAERALGELVADPRAISEQELANAFETAQRFGVTIPAGYAAPVPGLSDRYESALALLRDGDAEAGRALLEAAVAESPDDPIGLVELVLYLDRVDAPDAAERAGQLSERFADNATAQQAALATDAIWADEPLTSSAISRLRELTGPDAIAWKLAEARSRLRFNTTQRSAASAVQLLSEVREVSPGNTEALMLNAQAMQVLGDEQAMFRLMRSAVAAAPARADLRIVLIRELQASGRAAEAEGELLAFLPIRGLSAEQRRQRVQLLIDQGMRERAEAELMDLPGTPTPSDIALRARLRGLAGDHDAAENLFSRAVETEGAPPLVFELAADYYAARGNITRAWSVLDGLISSAANEAEQKRIRARYADSFGLFEQAEALLVEVAETSDAGDDWAQLATLRARVGRYDDARDAIDRGLAVDPEHIRLTRLDAITDAADSIRSEQPEIAQALLAVGSGASAPVAQSLADVLGANLRQGLGAEETIAALRAITEEHPSDYAAWAVLAFAQESSGDASGAVMTLGDASDRLPKDPRPARLAASALLAMGQPVEAIRYAREWRDRAPDRPYLAEITIARALAESGRFGDARSAFEPWRDQLRVDASSQRQAVEAYAVSLSRTGRLGQAESLLRELAETDPAWNARVPELAATIDDPAERRAWLIEREVLGESESEAVRLTYAAAWADLARLSEDAADLERSISLLSPVAESGGPSTMMTLASVLERADRLDAAESVYRDVLEMLPDQPVVKNNLAYLLVRRGGSDSEALELASSAWESVNSPRVAPALRYSVVDTLGSAQMAAGLYAEAAESFATAAGLRPAAAKPLLELAEAYFEAGDAEQARDALERFDDLADEDPSAGELAARADTLRSRMGGEG
ncbi:MAG: tetratricopeptide repeat protein [Planctomycetota bacterium]